MRILDLDLDFFLSDVPHCRSANDGRCDKADYLPWSADDVRTYLTSNCGLSTTSPIPGRFITQHDEAFAIWRDLIQSNFLTLPLQIVHIDSHADLGCGDGGYQYLMGDILHREPADRMYPESAINKMNFANYLAFAMACRWIDDVTYVTHANGGDDHFEYYFRNGDSRTGIVDLKAVDPIRLKDVMTILQLIPSMVPTEPPIQFRTVRGAKFSDPGNFDFMILCHSPSFTPVESDALIPVIREFINENG